MSVIDLFVYPVFMYILIYRCRTVVWVYLHLPSYTWTWSSSPFRWPL